jgi:DNA (cytosine-5)-methyltransferase 1
LSELTVVEIRAGAGVQALGLEQAGFAHAAARDRPPMPARRCGLTRQAGRSSKTTWPTWTGTGSPTSTCPLGGVPCPPFSIAAKQLGRDDDRDLFPSALRLIEEIGPRAVLLENVK